jgi:hypothetical protein
MRHITRYLNPMADLEILVNELRHPALNVPLDRPTPFTQIEQWWWVIPRCRQSAATKARASVHPAVAGSTIWTASSN